MNAMSQTYLSTHAFGDILVRFPHDRASGRVGLELVPVVLANQTLPRRTTLRGLPYIDAMPGNDPWVASVVESLVQFKVVGDQYPSAFAQGHTMRNSTSVEKFISAEQRVLSERGATIIVTRLTRPDGCLVEHRLSHRPGDEALEVSCAFTNASAKPVTSVLSGNVERASACCFLRRPPASNSLRTRLSFWSHKRS